jgi:hypothetical protein
MTCRWRNISAVEMVSGKDGDFHVTAMDKLGRIYDLSGTKFDRVDRITMTWRTN